MKYYKEAGVNPLASCLPLLLQVPGLHLAGLHAAHGSQEAHLRRRAEGGWRHHQHQDRRAASCNKLVPHSASFLFVNDITAKATGVVLVVLMVSTSARWSSTSVMMSVGSDRNQRLISIALPVVFVVFVIQFPAGLLVYWIATNFTMIPQQYFMLRRYGRPNVPVKVESNGRGSPGVAREAIKSRRRRRPRLARERSGRDGAGERRRRRADARGGLRELLETLIDAFGLDAEVVLTESDGVLCGSVEGPGAEALVGSEGTIIEAVQHLAQRIVLRGAPGPRVVVDAAGYRERREDALRAEADRVADRVMSEGRDVAAAPDAELQGETKPQLERSAEACPKPRPLRRTYISGPLPF